MTLLTVGSVGREKEMEDNEEGKKRRSSEGGTLNKITPHSHLKKKSWRCDTELNLKKPQKIEIGKNIQLFKIQRSKVFKKLGIFQGEKNNTKYSHNMNAVENMMVGKPLNFYKTIVG